MMDIDRLKEISAICEKRISDNNYCVEDEAIVFAAELIGINNFNDKTDYCALKSITDDQVKKVIRAFWRRIYSYRNDYDIELPNPLPVEFMAHMATALTWVDTDAFSFDKLRAAEQERDQYKEELGCALAAWDVRREQAKEQKNEIDRNDMILRASVADEYKNCASPIGAVQDYIGHLEQELESLRAKIKEAQEGGLKTIVKVMQLMRIKYPDLDLIHARLHTDESYGFHANGLSGEKHAEIFDADFYGIDSILIFCNRFIEENKHLISD